MKKRSVYFIICLIVLADQILKIYIKTHYHAGESHTVLGNWFQLYFIENEGMAYGWKLGGEWGKMALTLFRLAAVIFGVFYINKIVTKKYHNDFFILRQLSLNSLACKSVKASSEGSSLAARCEKTLFTFMK